MRHQTKYMIRTIKRHGFEYALNDLTDELIIFIPFGKDGKTLGNQPYRVKTHKQIYQAMGY